MPELKSERKVVYYKCGKCSGMIGYRVTEQPPDLCPECGYSYQVHGLRKVNDIPSTIRVNLNDLNNE